MMLIKGHLNGRVLPLVDFWLSSPNFSKNYCFCAKMGMNWKHLFMPPKWVF